MNAVSFLKYEEASYLYKNAFLFLLRTREQESGFSLGGKVDMRVKYKARKI